MNADDTEPDADTTRGIQLARSAVRLLRASDTGHRVRVGTMALGSLALIAVGAPLSDQLRPAAQTAAPLPALPPTVPITGTPTTTPETGPARPPSTPPSPAIPAPPPTSPTTDARSRPSNSTAAPATGNPRNQRQLDASRPPARTASPVPSTPSVAPRRSGRKPTIPQTQHVTSTVQPSTADQAAANRPVPTSATPEMSIADIHAMIERVIGLISGLRGPAPTVRRSTTLPSQTPSVPIGIPTTMTPPTSVTPTPPLPATNPHPAPPAPLRMPLPPVPPRPPVPAPGGQVGQWIGQAIAILAADGVPASAMNPHDIAVIIQHESGGNPHAINRTDANARAGHPSTGLMQTVDATFNRYKLPGHNDIDNPVDNIIAGVRYAIAKYGSVSNVPGVRSVAAGHGYRGY